MKCTKCGNENKDGAKFCRKCGAKLEAEEIKQEQTPKVEETKSLKEEAKEVKENVKVEAKKEVEKKPKINKEEDKTKQKPNEAKKEGKKSGAKKAFIIIVVLLILAALGVGGYFIYDEFFYKYDAKVEDNLNQYFETDDEKYLDKIQDIILKYSDDEEALNKIKEVSKKKIEKWIEDANAAEYKTEEEVEKAFSKIENKINKLQKANAIEKEDKETYSDKVTNLKESKTNYIDGLSEYESKSYDKAYESFGKVVEEDKLYESAQEYIEKCIGDTISKVEKEYKDLVVIPDGATSSEIKSKYVEAYQYLIKQNSKTSIDLNDSAAYRKLITESMTKIIEESVNIITDNINNKEYTTAKTNITEIVNYISSISGNKEYEELIKTSVGKITELTVSATDSLVASYSYDEAKTLLVDVKGELNKVKSASTYIKTIDDKIKDIESKMPISLLSLSTRSKDGSISLRGYSFEDADGNQYEKGITMYCYWKESYNCTYNLNGEYKRLKAKYGVCEANSSNDVSAYIKIYGDDKLLYTSEAIKWDSLPKELDVNISGVKMLKIEFVSEDLDRDVFIGNPELYK